MFENIITDLPSSFMALVVLTLVINWGSSKLGDSLHTLGVKLHIPDSVRGATFDAVSSSFPELVTALVAVLVYNQFSDVGLSTVSGSAIFNILIIPMFSIFFYKAVKTSKNNKNSENSENSENNTISVDKKTIIRDTLFYILSIGALIYFTLQGQYTQFSGYVLLAIYFAYVCILYSQYKSHKKNIKSLKETVGYCDEECEFEEDMTYSEIMFWITAGIFIIWFSIDGLVQAAITLSNILNIPVFITSVIIVAACTSIPDTILSVNSAKRGDADGAIANAIGSNIFDICICLGVPMIIAGVVLPVDPSESLGVLAFVVLSMITTSSLLLKNNVSKKDAYLMFFVYILFIVYIVAKTFGIIQF
ncbi:sodium:calcium antiporter [Methanococcus voltae]|uniref:Sodium/calcium exchanger membrane region n=1 Tax=Methanococcus voltae (strain ATCC BAA-1334 / A3) TaxID=456320 RepID=D7DS91_METV3|nr:sodium:calcium antiporter [Methanococcus voltae]MCS3901527.1 cation:H+ antiporter [Methanococcus voltae]